MVQGIAEATGSEDREARVFHSQALGRVSCSFIGRPVSIEFLPQLTAHRGKLLSGSLEKGQEVHAGSYLRKRQIVLDSALAGRELTRILLHELFHFAWIRLSNAGRASFSDVIQTELSRRARGELGWSAEWRKADPRIQFREYLCESFCDSGAWRYGCIRKHGEFTLANRWRERRGAWFDAAFPDRVIRI